MRKIVTLLLCLITFSSFGQRKLNIVFIGNSITQGAIMSDPEENSPPAVTVKLLKENGYQTQMANHGVSGSTTVDHLPQSETIFQKVKESADRFQSEGGELIFSITLGTNDSAISGPNGAPVSPVQYQVNMLMITSELLKLYPSSKIVIHYPLWYSPNTYNSAMYLAKGLERIVAYRPQIDKVVKSDGRIYLGDTMAYSFFEINHTEYYFAEKGNAGVFYLHPNIAGAKRLAEFWAQAIMNVVK